MWAYAVIFLVVVLAIGGATYVVWRQPSFWAGLLVVMAKAALPTITKQMTPEQTEAWHKAIRRGDDSEFQRKRRGAPPKG